MNPAFLVAAKEGLTNVVKNRIFQTLFVVMLLVGVIYYFAKSSAEKKLKLDQVDVSKLPSKTDPIDTITREELDGLISDCRSLFNDYSATPGIIILKSGLYQKLLKLSDQELGILNNQYNNLYAESDTNLYNEIKDDYWYSYDDTLRTKVLSRLVAIGAGKTKK